MNQTLKPMRRNTISTLIILLSLTYWSASAQFLESFDTEIPSTWTVIDNDMQGGTWQYYGGNPYQGTGGVRINFEEQAHDDYLISPQFIVNSGVSDQVSFYAGGTGATFPESFDVKLSTTGTNPSDFTVLLGSETTISDVDDLGEYINYTYNLSSYAGQPVYVAIVATSTAAFHLYVDEFSVEALPSCPKPSSLAFENLTATSLDLTWNPGGNETEWLVKYGVADFDPNTQGSGISVTGTANTSIGNLEANTLYNIYVRSICGGSEGESEFAGPLALVTPCLPAITPFFDGFENNTTQGSDLAGCWSQEIVTGASWKVNNSITMNNRAPRTGAWNIYIAYGSEAWMFYPIEVESGISYTLTFYARESNVSGADVSASYGLSNSSVDMVNEIIPYTEIMDGDYQEVSGTFIPEASGIIYIGIKGHMNGGFFPFYMALDDVSVTETQSCLNPTGLQADAATPTTADISWTPGGSETEWLVKYGEPGFDPATEGESILVSGSPNVTISELIPAHIYTVFVQAQCGGTDGNSHFAGSLTLKTPPVNDDLCNATALEVDGECNGSNFTNVGATLQTNEQQGSCFDAAGEQTVWFSFVAPMGGNVTVTTDFEGGTLEDTEVAVYEAPTDCTSLSTLGMEVGCDEDGGDVGEGFLSVVTLTGLTAGNTYYVQVNGFMSFGDGTFEGSFCIEVQNNGSSCLPPSDITIDNISSTTADINWIAGGNETEWEVKYGIAGFDPGNAGTILLDDDGIPGTTITDLEADTTYDVYVRAVCDRDNNSEFIGPQTFTTLVLSVETENFNSFTFYPNPVKDFLTLKANTPIESAILYNTLGQIIMDLKGNSVEMHMDTRQLQVGIYFLKVAINSTEKTFRLLKE